MQQDIFDVTFDILIKSLTVSPIDKAKSLDEDEGSVLYLSFQFRHWKFYYLLVVNESYNKIVWRQFKLNNAAYSEVKIKCKTISYLTMFLFWTQNVK